MGDFIFGFLIGKTIIWTFRLVRFLFRVAWWLTVFLLLSLGAGVTWLVRGGRSKPADGGRFGHYLEDGRLWRDDASGTAYPVSGTDREYCEIRAAEAGTYWRRTAVSRLVRMGAMLRYRFEATTDSAGSRELAAWCEFPQEARRNITLDHVDPELAGADPYGLQQNRELAIEAFNHMDWLLTNRGWHSAGRSADPSNAHWYATRYWRPVISWNAPVSADLAPRQSAELPADESTSHS